jgi:hypothetical protein
LKTPFNFCWGGRLAPSFLTPGGKGGQAGAKLWFNVLLHVMATLFVLVANGAFFINNADTWASGAMNAMAGGAIAFQVSAVLGTVISTAFFFRAGNYAFTNAIGIGLFLSAILFNTLAYSFYLHRMISEEAKRASMGQDRLQPSVEDTNYPIALVFQCWAFGSVLANAFALAKQRAVDEDV